MDSSHFLLRIYMGFVAYPPPLYTPQLAPMGGGVEYQGTCARKYEGKYALSRKLYVENLLIRCHLDVQTCSRRLRVISIVSHDFLTKGNSYPCCSGHSLMPLLTARDCGVGNVPSIVRDWHSLQGSCVPFHF